MGDSQNITWTDRESENGFSWSKWEQRVAKMQTMMGPDIDSVLDLGAGGMLLKKYLPANVSYYPVDYRSRCEETIVCDFNKQQFPELKADMVFISGCLEYVEDVEWFFDEIIQSCNKEILMSYDATEHVPDVAHRRSRAWVNDLNVKNIVQAIQQRGFLLVDFDHYLTATLFRFRKSHPRLLPEYKACTGCGACCEICPTGALELVPDEDGFLHPFFQERKCIECGECTLRCPTLHLKFENSADPMCYAVQAQDDIREVSSSGGLFTLLANEIFDQSGFVCGVRWTEGFGLEFAIINDRSELPQLRRSKYAQCNTSSVFAQIKVLLDRGQLVLYTGCPCQVAGLYAFLGKNYAKLYTVDLLCHLVPSPIIFKKYLQDNYGIDKMKSFEFRTKQNNWRHDEHRITLKDGSVILKDSSNDWLQIGYHPRLFMNKTCEYCQFARLPRVGDITIGDFWGIEQYDPKLHDPKGTSVLLVNNGKGMELVERVKPNCKLLQEVPIQYTLGNRITPHLAAHPMRDRFFDLIKKETFNKAVEDSICYKYDVGIVGIWSVENHGSNLTYYALYRTIVDMGLEPVMIERPLSSPWAPNALPVGFKINPYKQYHLGGMLGQKRDLKAWNNNCETFLVGSDQLFAIDLYNAFGQYITLDWIKDDKKKISYATSFGADKFGGSELTRAEMSHFMKKFDAFSVREDSGVQLALNEFGTEAEWVLDPVFLCKKNYFIELTEIGEKPPHQHYLGVYMLDPSNAKAQAIRFASEQLSLPIYAISDSVYKNNEANMLWDIETKTGVFNEDWLRNIYDCEFFITDSFHGMCFAIIFNKPFIVIANEKRGITRFTSLAKLLGLADRIIMNSSDIFERLDLLKPFNKVAVYKILETEKQRCLQWLKDKLAMKKRTSLSTYDILDDKVDTANIQLEGHQGHLNGLQQGWEAHQAHLNNLQGGWEVHRDHLNGLQQGWEAHQAHLDNLQGGWELHRDHLNGLQQGWEAHQAHLNNLQGGWETHQAHLNNLQGGWEAHQAHLNSLQQTNDEQTQQIEQLGRRIEDLNNCIIENCSIKRRMKRMLPEPIYMVLKKMWHIFR